jgi:CRISPR-associated protein Cas1
LFCRKPSRKTTTHVAQDDILIDLPLEDVDHVMVFGNIQITTQAMHTMLRDGVEMAMLTRSGDLVGQLTPPGGKNIFLRQKQYKQYNDPVFRLNFSKSVVQSKIHSAVSLLRAYHKHHRDAFPMQKIDELLRYVDRVENADGIDSVLGFEGAASSLYFSLLGSLVHEPWSFSRRSRRPPRDAANAILSYGYTIVAAELQSLLDGMGFDPYLGFYHEIAYGRPGLALDLMEPFRHALIDRLMLNLFSLSVMKENDFTKMPKGGIYLSHSGKVKFFRQYEKMVGHYRGQIIDAKNRGKFRVIMQDEVERLASSIREESDFEPYTA